MWRMQTWMQTAVAVAVLVRSNLASPPNQAVVPDQALRIRNETSSVAVDLPLPNVPGQVHIGDYKQVSEDLYIRDLPGVNVYFSLQHLPPSDNDATDSITRWQFRGFDCSFHDHEKGRECTEIVTTELESDRDQHPTHSRWPHIIARPSFNSAEERRLQFEEPGSTAPPSFPTQTAYYSCAYSGGGSDWCCAQSNQGSGGPYCWSLSTCTEDKSAWNQQNIICCTASAGDCVLTYEPTMPTATPAIS